VDPVLLFLSLLVGLGVLLAVYFFQKKNRKRQSYASSKTLAKEKSLNKALPGAKDALKIGFFKRLNFYISAQEQGFKFAELKLLLDFASIMHIDPPQTLLIHTKVLDSCLNKLMEPAWRKAISLSEEAQALVFKLLSYRMEKEQQRPRYVRGMDSSRSIEVNQVLKILLPDKVVLLARVLDLGRNFLKVEVFQGKIPLAFVWKGQSLDVWFWRKDDAMYQFQTSVSVEPEQNQLQTILHLRHSDKLLRQQKRSSLRARVMRDGELIPLSRLEEVNEQHHAGQGYMCRVVDISESGAAVIIRGRAKAGLFLKIQLPVDDGALVLCGEIKSVEEKKQFGVSLLHIEAFPLSRWMRTQVLAYVLGFLKHGNDPKPQTLDDEQGTEPSAEEIAETQEHLSDIPAESRFLKPAEEDQPRLPEEEA